LGKGYSMKMLEKGTMYVVAGATSGIGKAVGEIIEEDYYPVGGRNLETLAEIGSKANKRGFFIPGNLFDKSSSAYKFFINELYKYKQKGVVQLYSSIDMDPIPFEKDGVIIEDYYDPRNGKKWEDKVSVEEKKTIRKEMADSQIVFWENLLESLLKRDSDEPLVIIYANSIIAKFYENHSVRRHSEYGRLKNKITKSIEAYAERLEAKNVFVKNILLGIIDTPMFNNRGVISAKRTQKMVEVLAPNIPLNGEEITATAPLNADDIAKFLYQIGEIYPKATPSKINLFKPEHLDIQTMMHRFIHKKNNITRLIVQNIHKKIEDVVIMDDKTKQFLIDLREESLIRYYEENLRNTRIKEKKLKDNLIMGERIISSLSPTLSKEVFLDTCLRLEGNYP